MGFIGTVFILHPKRDLFQMGAIFGLLSGISLATALIIVQLLSTTEPKERIVFYFLLVGTLVTGALFPFFGTMVSKLAILYGAIAGLFLVLAQDFIVRAYNHASAHDVGAFQYVSVVFAGLYDWMIWKIAPNLYDLIGVILVVLGGSLVLIFRKK